MLMYDKNISYKYEAIEGIQNNVRRHSPVLK